MDAAPAPNITRQIAHMAIVEANVPYAIHGKTGLPYVLAFGKNQYFVPETAVRSYPKRSNKGPKLSDGADLGAALATKAPERWMAYCNPDTLMHIEGNSNDSCIYTTFDIPGHPNEARFLHHISGAIAAKNFPEWEIAVEKGIKEETIPERKEWNERLTRRYAVLNWKKEKDCPDRNQLHPELNKWVSVTKDGGELVQTCKVAPEAKRRPKGAGDKRSATAGGEKRGTKRAAGASAGEDSDMFDVDDVVKFRKGIKVGPKGSYTIDELDGMLVVTQYADGHALAASGGAGGGDAARPVTGGARAGLAPAAAAGEAANEDDAEDDDDDLDDR